jgi:hypothetical protein
MSKWHQIANTPSPSKNSSHSQKKINLSENSPALKYMVQKLKEFNGKN